MGLPNFLKKIKLFNATNQNTGFVSVCGCNTGRVRRNNQDNFYFNGIILPADNQALNEVLTAVVEKKQGLTVGVFDGMGGEKNGEHAAYIAALKLKELALNSRPDLNAVCIDANREICNQADSLGGQRMGCTAAMLYLVDNDIELCNIGDSRIFLLRGSELKQLSVDHTDSYFVNQAGSKRKPALTQHLGIWPDEMLIEPYLLKAETQIDDLYIICSDGITDMISNTKIVEILKSSNNLKAAAENLISTALENGGRDNITVILTQVC